MSAQPDFFSLEETRKREARAKQLRDEGIRQAADHAGDDWKSLAYALFLQFLAQWPGELFMTEDARHWASGRIELPPDNRAWGYVAVRAAKAGVIVKHGYGPQRDPKHHKAPGTVWRIVR
jgi:hypothetical protein